MPFLKVKFLFNFFWGRYGAPYLFKSNYEVIFLSYINSGLMLTDLTMRDSLLEGISAIKILVVNNRVFYISADFRFFGEALEHYLNIAYSSFGSDHPFFLDIARRVCSVYSIIGSPCSDMFERVYTRYNLAVCFPDNLVGDKYVN